MGYRRETCKRMYERTGADRRSASEFRQLGFYDVCFRRCVCTCLFYKEAMDMNAPFFKYGMFGDEVSLIVAFMIGIGFGFFLERAGFGNAKKLAAQFYFTDMSVLKVMFSAIVTAMLGVYYLSVIGWVDLSMVYLTPTNILPQIVGGLLLGFGFVIGGYCPGTSCVVSCYRQN